VEVKKKKRRGSLSISGITHSRLKEHCTHVGIPMARIVEMLIRQAIREGTTVETTR